MGQWITGSDPLTHWPISISGILCTRASRALTDVLTCRFGRSSFDSHPLVSGCWALRCTSACTVRFRASMLVIRRYRSRRMWLAGSLAGATECCELWPGPATQIYWRLMLSVIGAEMCGLRRLIGVAGIEECSIIGSVLTSSRPQHAAVTAAVHAVKRCRRRRSRVTTTGTSIRRRDVSACAETRKRKLECGSARWPGDPGMVTIQHHCRRTVIKSTRPTWPLYTRLTGSRVDHVTGSGAARRPVGSAEAVGSMLEVVGVVLV